MDVIINNDIFIQMIPCYNTNIESISFFDACETGKLDIIENLLSENKINIYIHKYEAFKLSCSNGHVDVVKYLLTIKDININVYKDDGKIFKKICTDGYFDLVVLILNINENIHYDICKKSFREACVNGHVKIAKYLEKYLPASVNEPFCRFNSLFCDVCKNGHLEVVKFLLNMKDNNININSRYDYAFRGACCNGHFSVVEYLLNRHNNNIDINIDSMYAFKISLENRYDNISMLLYKHNIKN
jgi:ankyrin repeat protein